MATYAFVCTKCKTSFEVTCHMDEREAKAVCPKCGSHEVGAGATPPPSRRRGRTSTERRRERPFRAGMARVPSHPAAQDPGRRRRRPRPFTTKERHGSTGRSARPDFTLKGVVDGEFVDVKLSDYRGKWVVLFFYPLDFTFVCPTEIRGFAGRNEEFEKLGAQVLGASVDSEHSHKAWIERDFGSLPFPLLSDIRREATEAYGVLLPEGIALRGTFIVDPEGMLGTRSCTTTTSAATPTRRSACCRHSRPASSARWTGGRARRR